VVVQPVRHGFRTGGIAKVVKATKLAELGRLRRRLYTAFTPEASEPERHPRQQFPGRRVLLLWSWLTVGLVVVQGSAAGS